jgi:hypothetical protein
MNTFFMPRRQRNEVADELRIQAIECRDIAQRHCDLMKEQYEALARQCLIIAAQASPLRM